MFRVIERDGRIVRRLEMAEISNASDDSSPLGVELVGVPLVRLLLALYNARTHPRSALHSQSPIPKETQGLDHQLTSSNPSHL